MYDKVIQPNKNATSTFTESWNTTVWQTRTIIPAKNRYNFSINLFITRRSSYCAKYDSVGLYEKSYKICVF